VLYLIRNAMPDIRKDRPPDRWRLGGAGRAAVLELRPRVPADAYTVASSEYKAIQTAVLVSGAALVDRRLDEVRRPGVWTPHHRALACAYLAGTVHEGWEEPASVVARWDTALHEHHKAADGSPLVAVGHGMALSLWLASRFESDPVRCWLALRLPDLWRVDLEEHTAERVEDAGPATGSS
jgi:broad specificity phosphatase PhoE